VCAHIHQFSGDEGFEGVRGYLATLCIALVQSMGGQHGSTGLSAGRYVVAAVEGAQGRYVAFTVAMDAWYFIGVE